MTHTARKKKLNREVICIAEFKWSKWYY